MSNEPAIHDFAEQFANGHAGEDILDGFFGAYFNIERASREQERHGIDRIFIDPEGRRWKVEYKTDYAAARTGNVFVETVSKDAPPSRSGWAFTCTADRLVYYIAGYNAAYVFNPVTIRKHIERWRGSYPVKVAVNRSYATYGVLVPVAEFIEHAKQRYEVRP